MAGGDNGWFNQNCDPTDDPNAGQQEVASGGGPVNTGSDGVTPAQKTVNQVIENLLGQCYPSQAPQTIRNFVPEDDEVATAQPIEYDFSGILDGLLGLGIDPGQIPSKVQFSFPNAKEPTSGAVCTNTFGEYDSAIRCQEEFDFKQCIKDHIDCIFRPYAGGTWKPPQADCDQFSSKSQYGLSNKVCVRNCVPLRVPIWEHVSASNHLYSLSDSPPSGYTDTKVAFYAHAEEQPNSIPLYISYSSSTVDTMLTTNPAGEKSTMDAAGMGARDDVFVYVYGESNRIISALGEGEQGQELYRYYNPTTQDHRYTLNPIGGTPLAANLSKGYYSLRHEVSADLLIEFNCQRGSASYDNTFGYYIAPQGQGLEPVYGQVVLPNATDATGYKSFTIPAATINQYVPCRLGFVLIPDGDQENSGVSEGDTLTFSETSNGWRTNLSSAESNLAMFSEKRLNWNEKSFTKWTSRWWQYWEDLLDGDDDYDDVKISYRLNYANSNWYYEGVQCYVFEDSITPEYMDLNQKSGCDKNLFEPGGFFDVFITRHDCGQITEDGYGCGKCEGDYSNRKNVVQSITATSSGQISIRSHGGMTSGYGECVQFTWSLKKNGTTIYQEKSRVEDWKRIGEVFHTFSVVEGDDITFSVESVDSGHFNATATPTFSLRDETAGDLFSTWSVTITTVSHKMPGTNDATCGKPGQISLVDMLDSSLNVVAWTSGGGVTGNWLTTPNRPRFIGTTQIQDGDTGYMIRETKRGLSMQIQYEALSNGSIRYKINSMLDTFGAAGYHVNEKERYFLGVDKKGNGEKFYQAIRVDTIDGTACVANGIVQTVKFGAVIDNAETGEFGVVEPVQMINLQAINSNYYDIAVNELVEHLFTTDLRDSSGSVSNYYGEPVTLVQYWARKTANNEPVYFYHDFVFAGSDPFRVRMRAQLIRKDTALNNGQPESALGFNFRWTVESVSSYGTGYYDGLRKRFEFPDRDDDNYEGESDTAPYYPSQKSLPKKIKIKNSETNAVSRSAKWAMYQESHDTASTVWYSNLSRSKSAQFKLYQFIIEDAS